MNALTHEEIKNKEFRDGVALRFILAMRHVISVRIHGVKTATQFAHSIGEHPQNMSKFEKGERYPTVDQICRVCLIYGISPAWILLDQGEMRTHHDLIEDVRQLQLRMTTVEKQIELIATGKSKR